MLRTTRETIGRINCCAKDDSSGGGPFHAMCGGPTLADAVACARENIHYNYVRLNLEISVAEIDLEGSVRSLSTRFVNPLVLDRAVSPEPQCEQLQLLTESVDCFHGKVRRQSVVATFDNYTAAAAWFAQQQACDAQVEVVVNRRREFYGKDGVVCMQVNDKWHHIVLEKNQ